MPVQQPRRQRCQNHPGGKGESGWMLLQGLDRAKKCDGRKMPGQEDQPSGENAFHIISSFCPSIFLPPSLKTEFQLKGELNPKRLLQGCSLLLIAAIETQAAFCEEFSFVDCGSLLPLWFGQPVAERRVCKLVELKTFVHSRAVVRKVAAGCGSPK